MLQACYSDTFCFHYVAELNNVPKEDTCVDDSKEARLTRHNLGYLTFECWQLWNPSFLPSMLAHAASKPCKPQTYIPTAKQANTRQHSFLFRAISSIQMKFCMCVHVFLLSASAKSSPISNCIIHCVHLDCSFAMVINWKFNLEIVLNRNYYN